MEKKKNTEKDKHKIPVLFPPLKRVIVKQNFIQKDEEKIKNIGKIAIEQKLNKNTGSVFKILFKKNDDHDQDRKKTDEIRSRFLRNLVEINDYFPRELLLDKPKRLQQKKIVINPDLLKGEDKFNVHIKSKDEESMGKATNKKRERNEKKKNEREDDPKSKSRDKKNMELDLNRSRRSSINLDINRKDSIDMLEMAYRNIKPVVLTKDKDQGESEGNSENDQSYENDLLDGSENYDGDDSDDERYSEGEGVF
jgi:hypothetical protein